MKVLGWQDFWIYAIFSLFKTRIVPKSHLRKKKNQQKLQRWTGSLLPTHYNLVCAFSLFLMLKKKNHTTFIHFKVFFNQEKSKTMLSLKLLNSPLD